MAEATLNVRLVYPSLSLLRINGLFINQDCVIPSKMAMKVPSNLSLTEAAAIPEGFLTAFQTLFTIGQVHSGQDVLIHAAARYSYFH